MNNCSNTVAEWRLYASLNQSVTDFCNELFPVWYNNDMIG